MQNIQHKNCNAEFYILIYFVKINKEDDKVEKKISFKQYLVLASMLFGLFFGAGNLIFPIHMGQLAGRNYFIATLGFCATGVGLPLLGIIAMGISRSEGLFDMAKKVGTGFSYFFTIALYLTIGPLFAIPRCATVSYQVGVSALVGEGYEKIALFIFSLVFFIFVLFFALRPSGIMTWIGKVLNPIFLLFLGIIIAAVLLKPMGDFSLIMPSAEYADHGFIKGMLEGYNTMDALASLAFGIILIESIKRLGVKDASKISLTTMKAGIITVVLMAVIYILITYVGAQSVESISVLGDGGTIFYYVSHHYFGAIGSLILGITITFACLKTAIGLITACGETFSEILPFKISYKAYAIGFCVFSFAIANVGLEKLIAISVPVLIFLYPITIALIALCIAGPLYNFSKKIMLPTIVMTVIASVFELILALPKEIQAVLPFWEIKSAIYKKLPLADVGMGWVSLCIAGAVIGCVLYKLQRSDKAK